VITSSLVTRARRLPYGWIIVAVLCVTETVTWGIIYYGFPVFLRPMEEALGASRVAITGAFSVGLGVSALLALPVGRWLDRHGPRALMTAGSCLATALTFAWSQVESLPALYAVWFLMGFALASTLYEPAFAVVVSWFTHQRDTALLVLTLAGGLASTIFMPIAAWLLDRLGWRPAIVTLAIVLGVITIPLHALLLRRGPADLHRGAQGKAIAAPGVTLGEATRTPVFWVLTAAFVISSFASVTITIHLIPFLGERGYTATVAAAAVGWIGFMQVFGRAFFIPIATRMGPLAMTAAVFATQGLGIAQLPLVGRYIHTVVPFVAMQGMANGMSTLVRASTLAELFGARHYGAISGAMALGANGARALAPVAASVLWVALGGYEALFWSFAAALVAAAGAVLVVRARTITSTSATGDKSR
jgi:MFS family permease